MADVSVLGLGQMGAAFASVLLKAGYGVAVWNRSPEARERLAGEGAEAFDEAAGALAAAPVAIVCVSDYQATDAFLKTEAGTAALKGKILVQLSSGSPRAVKAAQDWVTAAGARYLDGGIMVYPDDIGTPESKFIIAGDAGAYETARPLIEALAPKTEYLGEDAAMAAALDSAIICAALGAIFGVLNGAALCEAAGVPLKQFTKLVREITPVDLEQAAQAADKIAEGTLEETDAQLSVWNDATRPMVEIAEDTGYSAEVPRFFQGLFKRAIDQGLGEQDVGALIAALRPRR